jgi:hypothetical protein
VQEIKSLTQVTGIQVKRSCLALVMESFAVLNNSRFIKKIILFSMVLLLSACQWMTKRELDNRYGEESKIERITTAADADLYHKAQTVIDQRCVVCHACYDAPCQLKLNSLEGMDRGASKTEIYDAYRLLATSASPLFFEDGEGHAEWREQEFYPVLNERQQTAESNLDLSVMYNILALKNDHPLPEGPLLPEDFDLNLKRNQFCPKIEEFDTFSKDHQLWGMPYGLPAINQQEFVTLKKWIAEGSQIPLRSPLSPALKQQVDHWESFFNGQGLKEKLVNRYLYEHLFLAHLYFDEVDQKTFFRIVRSYTPPGQPISVMPSRRPYEKPADDTFYYRLQQVHSSIVAKTHMPYSLNKKRYDLWQELFYQTQYEVSKLPSYEVEVSSNPFLVFEEIPIASRYKFLLDEAHFSIMNFIKGPVCRGRIALSVINDHFFVVFVNPDLPSLEKEENFLKAHKNLLRFPAYWESNGNLWSWFDLAQREQEYLNTRAEYMNKYFTEELPINMDVVWDGYDGVNDNAALTIFRHNDSATVVKGFAGEKPQTAWLIDYPLMERIHYLLVAGFDINGNIVHQLTTRLYMDFLRMEGEANFIALLPKEERENVLQDWYRNQDEDVKEHFDFLLKNFTAESAIPFKTAHVKNELFGLLSEKTNAKRYSIKSSEYPDIDLSILHRINGSAGVNISYLPQTAILEVVGNQRSYWFTLLHNNAYFNKTHLLAENTVRDLQQDSLLIVPEIMGAYPNAFYKVNEKDLADFVGKIETLSSEADYFLLMSQYGIRRTDKSFWEHSDRVHQYYKQSMGLEYGLLDYNRLENR